MKVTIQEKKENPLLNRTEIKGNIEFDDITPSNVKLSESLAKETKKEINLIIVKSIYTNFGQKLADFEAIIYDNAESRDKVEMLTKHIKKKMEEDRKKSEEAKAAEVEAKKKEEEAKAAPAEEAKEEAPVEEKPAEETKETPAEKAEEKAE
jgi:small subunit ribosomal protein S24e